MRASSHFVAIQTLVEAVADQLSSTKTSDKEPRRAILSNRLVNPHGQQNTWQEVDRSLEYLNLELKREL